MGKTVRRSRGPQPCPQPSPRPHHGRLAASLAALALLGALAACTEDTAGSSAPAAPPPAPDLSTCAATTSGDVVGRRPTYLARTLGRTLTPLAISDAVCAGRWLAPMQRGFVPQGLSLRDGTAWVSGYDPGPVGHRFCRVLRIDLASGRVLDQRSPVTGSVTGSVGTGPEAVCRHGGGSMLDEHGLWLTELSRLWLLDPATLDVRRVWRLETPVRGSFGVLDDAGRLGLGQYRRGGRPSLTWFDLDDVLAPGTLALGLDVATGSRRIPRLAQGGTWARIDGRTGVWIASSTTRCGVLTGPRGVRRAFLPGAEGLAAVGDGTVWAVSESAARQFAREGGRPVVAPLSLVDTRRLGRWPEPTCEP